VSAAVKSAGAGAAKVEVGPVRFSADGRRPRRFTLRAWSVRHAGWLEGLYRCFSAGLAALEPVVRRIGYGRMEKPVAFVERGAKGLFFDCRMCGSCILSSTGMSCPMNCPKQLRNGPCGGVRANGNCEVIADMPCVWVKAWEGSRLMENGDAILAIQPPVNQALRETSSWLRVMRSSSPEGEARA
jgi:Methylene-tetrahydrofolate reductase C terminal